MVYIAKKKNGEVVHHTSLEALKAIDGIGKPDLKIPDEEFEAAGCLARVIDGQIVIGKTQAELTTEQNQKRIAEIESEMQSIDAKSGRAARAVSLAVANGNQPNSADTQKLQSYEETVAALRAELNALQTQV